MKTWITQLRKGVVELLMLNVMSRGETYGYDIVQQLRKAGGMEVSESTVYPVLERLHKSGYISVRREPSPNGPTRRYYSLTTAGKHRVRAMNDYWDSLNQSMAGLRRKGESDV